MRVEPNHFYVTIHESLKRKDGSASLYSCMMFSGQELQVPGSSFGMTKAKLLSIIQERFMSFVPVHEFSVIETSFGWIFERYLIWEDEDHFNYTIGSADNYTDHEQFVADITYYTEDVQAFRRLR